MHELPGKRRMKGFQRLGRIFSILVFAVAFLTELSESPAQDSPLPDDPGAVAFWNGEYALALSEWTRKAELGDAEAMNNIGVLYNKGLGVSRDYREAASWYERAAVLGFAIAQYNLANLYFDGSGVRRDHTQAAAWYLKAAMRGHLGAQYFISQLAYRHSAFGLLSTVGFRTRQ
jgi:TPR repeat protein